MTFNPIKWGYQCPESGYKMADNDAALFMPPHMPLPFSHNGVVIQGVPGRVSSRRKWTNCRLLRVNAGSNGDRRHSVPFPALHAAHARSVQKTNSFRFGDAAGNMVGDYRGDTSRGRGVVGKGQTKEGTTWLGVCLSFSQLVNTEDRDLFMASHRLLVDSRPRTGTSN